MRQLFFKDETNLACFALFEFADRHLCYDNECYVLTNVQCVFLFSFPILISQKFPCWFYFGICEENVCYVVLVI